MQVVAYKFEEREEAENARAALLMLFDMSPTDALVAPVDVAEAVVAVRAHEEHLPIVKRILEEHGGEHATEMPEEWTLAD